MELNQLLEIEGWIMRQRIPQGPGPYPLVVMLHGWTGDENAMWIFASRMPQNAMLLAPRGLYSTPMGGYGWHPHKARVWPWVDDFQPAVEALHSFLNGQRLSEVIDFSHLRLVGFSQGAALAFTYAMQYPEQIELLAGLSGFLPDGAATLAGKQPLQGKKIFLAHGTRDELVPVDKARLAVSLLQQAGAQVTYCEDDVGHKLSLSCFRGLETFFKRN